VRDAVTEKGQERLSSDRIVKDLGFIPSIDTLSQMSKWNLQDHCLTAVHYSETLGPTFEFTSGAKAPPAGSYSQVASIKSCIKRGKFVSRITLGLHEKQDFMLLVYLKFKDESKEVLADCNFGKGMAATRAREMAIGSTEVIVGANVTTNGDRYPCTINFIVLDY